MRFGNLLNEGYSFLLKTVMSALKLYLQSSDSKSLSFQVALSFKVGLLQAMILLGGDSWLVIR